MADIKEVIKGLKDIQKHLDTGYSFAISWKSELIRDTLTLLKEQETELCDRCGRRRLKSNREVK